MSNSVPAGSARRFYVSGRVQGVFFRASCAREAARLDIAGRAVNLADGRVEVLACGTAEALDQLGAWLHHGPPGARVESVRSEPSEVAELVGFTTG